MGKRRCEACDDRVQISGGIAAIWSFSQEPSGGMTLEFPDGLSAFLCFSCLDALPDDPAQADVEAAIGDSE